MGYFKYCITLYKISPIDVTAYLDDYKRVNDHNNK